MSHPPDSRHVEFNHSLREMRCVAILWLVVTIYSVTVCSVWGYHRTVESLTYYFGFPDWVFWGVIVPWGACSLFSIWFALFFMQDDDIRESTNQEEVTE